MKTKIKFVESTRARVWLEAPRVQHYKHERPNGTRQLFEFRLPDFDRRVLCLLLLLTFLPVTGCVSKSQAREQARLAYLAGQRDTAMRLQQQPSGPTVTFIGPLNAPVVNWVEGLTLSQAILRAGYNSQDDPKNITIRRLNQMIQIDPNSLLHGQDFPLQPGDVIEFQ